MVVDAPFVSDGKTPEAIDPSQGAFDNPAIAAEPLAYLDAAPGDAVGVLRAAQQLVVQPLPGTGRLPVAQPSPEGCVPNRRPAQDGYIAREMPLHGTNRMLVSAAHPENGGRPPFGRGQAT